MSTFAAKLPTALARLGRRQDGSLLAGVCSGLAHAAHVDATLIRLIFALLTLAGGAGAVAYAGAWLALPVEGGQAPSQLRRAAGVLLLAGATVLAFRALGVADSVVWPAALVGGGVFLVLRRPDGRLPKWQVALAVVLVVAGSLLFMDVATNDGRRGSLVAPAGLLVALFLVVGPWAWRLARERDAERLERIRAQARADMAARVHDSVLQTLALVQKNADDPKRVAALARRQERELRGWLYGGTAPGTTLGTALENALADVEELHGVRVELVQTGDRVFDERLRALVLAAREALTNASVHAGVEEVAVFVEVGDEEIAVFVRDRGTGFEREAVPADRRGIADSIEGRMSLHGGSASVRSAVGEGTEVELRLPLEAS